MTPDLLGVPMPPCVNEISCLLPDYIQKKQSKTKTIVNQCGAAINPDTMSLPV